MDSFRRKIKDSFAAAHADIDSLKESIVEWITTIVSNQKTLLEKVNELETRLEKLEKRKP